MSDPTNPADKTHTVIQGGRRVTGPLSEQDAKKEADKRNHLAESAGQKVPENQKARVVQNLMG